MTKLALNINGGLIPFKCHTGLHAQHQVPVYKCKWDRATTPVNTCALLGMCQNVCNRKVSVLQQLISDCGFRYDGKHNLCRARKCRSSSTYSEDATAASVCSRYGNATLSSDVFLCVCI